MVGFRKNIFAVGIVVLSFLLLAAGSCYLLRNQVLNLAVREWLLPLAAENGVAVHFDRLQTDLFSTITFEQVQISEVFPDGARLQARIKRLALHYETAVLIRDFRKGIARASLVVDAAESKISVGAKKGGEQHEEVAELALQLPPLPWWLPAIDIRNSSLDLTVASRRVDMRGMTIVLGPAVEDSGTRAVKVKVAELTQDGLPLPRALRRVSAELQYAPDSILLQTLEAGGSKVADNFSFSVDEEGGIFCRGDLYLFDGVAALDIAIRGQHLQGSLTSRKIELANIPSSLVEGSTELTGTLSLRSFFDVDLRQPDKMRGTLSLLLERGKIAGVRVNSLKAELQAKDGLLHAETIEVESPDNRLELHEMQVYLEDLGRSDFLKIARRSTAEFFVSMHNWREVDALLPASIRRQTENLDCRRLSLQGNLAAGSLTIDQGSLGCKAASVELDKAKYLLPEAPGEWGRSELQAGLHLVLMDLSGIRQFLPPEMEKLDGSFEIKGSVSGPMESLGGDLTVTGHDVVFKNLPAVELAGRVLSKEGIITLRDFSISREEDRITLAGSIPLDSLSPLSVKCRGRLKEVGDYVRAFFPDLPVQGDLSFSVKAAGSFHEPFLSVRLQAGKVTYEDRSFQNGQLTAEYDGTTLKIEQLQVNSDEGELQLSATAVPEQENWHTATFRFDTLRFKSNSYKVELAEPASLHLADDRIKAERALVVDAGFGLLELSGNVGKQELDLRISGADLRIPKEGKMQLPGNFNFESAGLQLHLYGSFEEPAISGSGKIHGLTGKEVSSPLDGDFSFVFDTAGLELRKFNWIGEQSGTVSLNGHLPVAFKKGRLQPLATSMRLVGVVDLPQLHLLHQFFPDYIEPEGSIHADVNLTGTLDKPKGYINLQAKGLHPSSALNWLPPGELSVDLKMATEKNALLVETLRMEGSELGLEVGGKISGDFLLSDLLRFSVPKVAGRADLHGRLVLPELSWTAERFSRLRRVNGRLEVDFTLTGPLDNPQFEAAVSLEDGELRSSASLPVLREMNGKALLDREGITITSLHGTIGGGAAEVTGRILFAEQNRHRLDLKLSGKDLLFYRSDWGKVRGDADFTITGTYLEPFVEGKILLTDGYYGRNINLLAAATSNLFSAGPVTTRVGFSLFSFTDEPMKNARFSIRAKAKTAFKVNTNLIKGELRPDLLLSGTGELPQLTGEIYVDWGRVNLPAGRLDIDAGLIHFLESDPDRPSLELTGSAKMMGYDITAKINGPYDEPTVSLSSNPPLANEDLLLLLLGGRRPPVGTGENGGAEMSRVAVYLGREMLTSLFGKEYANSENVLDRLQLDIGRGITKQGEETIEARFLLTEGLLKKNDAVYLTAEKDIWDDYNGGLRLIFRFP